MKDSLGRELRDLRVSVTDRCNFRCFFCMPPESEIHFLRREELLTYEEIHKVVKALTKLGVKKVRITGGEPLLRAHIERLIDMLSSVEGLRDIALTTNGYTLEYKAQALKDNGLKRITVSLLSLQEDKFRNMVGRSFELAHVIRGIEEAKRAGLEPVKVNMVVVKGVNDDEIIEMANFCRERELVLRFIEFMDVGTMNNWSMDRVVSAEEIISLLDKEFGVEPVGKEDKGETSLKYKYKDNDLEVGVIASVTKPFCSGCTRLRLSADGKLFTCLFSEEGHELKELIRSGASEEDILDSVKSLWLKRKDRYSEQRWEILRRGGNLKKVEMFRVGG